ncbi:MAG: DUF2065 domain-containing protein [Alphaproteobacteria bacterium]|nr:DUF2065 domain-containing protein [Alphaproteobacteria bacterium]
MELLLAAFALFLLIEGSLYALFPAAMKRMIAEVLQMPDALIRNVGMIAAAVGFGALWLVYR